MSEPCDATPDEDAVYRTLLESTRAIPWRIDWKTLRFTYVGPQIEDLLGWRRDSWVGVQDWAERMHPEDRERVVDHCVSQSQAGTDHEADYRALRSDGQYVWIRDVVHVMRGTDGEVEALVGFMFDISERKRTEQRVLDLQRELEALSYQDGLTGVANRRRFDTVLESEWASARRKGLPLTLILLDIDHFKEFNDRYGHLAGDDCLRRVACALQEAALRPRDFVARYGGEEFVLVLPETDAASARTVAERVRRGVQALDIAHDRSPVAGCVTVSLGIGTLVPQAAHDPQRFLHEVDTLLYRAKQRGRNRAECAS